jgi:O-antigen/teichoic acid export membrane protein
VFRLGKLIGGSASRLFITTRGISSALALLLALTYTKLLGLEKRSVLTFIMVSALILTIVFTSGLSLGLRNKSKKLIKNEEYIGYIILILGASLMVGLVNCILLLTYSRIKTEIPFPIFVVCFVYSTLACLTLGLQDALFAAGNLKTVTIFDVTTILIQISVFFFLISIAKTSLIISIFISFIFSYSIISFASLTIFLFTTPIERSQIVTGIKIVLNQSKKQHLFGIATGLADRLDRFLIGLILPITFLAKYALLSSITSFARFLPDSLTKVSLFRHHRNEKVLGVSYSFQSAGFMVFAGFFLAGISQIFIFYVFGENWLLPSSVTFLIISQEILRGIYQARAMKLISLGGAPEVSRISGLLIAVSVSMMPLLLFTIGIWGAPLAMIFNYSILILLLEKEIKVFSNAR